MEKSIIIAIGSGLVLGLGLLYVHQKMTEKEEVKSEASGVSSYCAYCVKKGGRCKDLGGVTRCLVTRDDFRNSSFSGWNDGNIVQKYQRPNWVVG